MEQIQLMLIAWMPSIAAIGAVIALVIKVICSFRDLRSAVIDEKTVNAIYADNKRLTAKYRETMEEISGLKSEVRTLSEINLELLSEIKKMNKED